LIELRTKEGASSLFTCEAVGGVAPDGPTLEAIHHVQPIAELHRRPHGLLTGAQVGLDDANVKWR